MKSEAFRRWAQRAQSGPPPSHLVLTLRNGKKPYGEGECSPQQGERSASTLHPATAAWTHAARGAEIGLGELTEPGTP